MNVYLLPVFSSRHHLLCQLPLLFQLFACPLLLRAPALRLTRLRRELQGRALLGCSKRRRCRGCLRGVSLACHLHLYLVRLHIRGTE